MTPRNEKKTHFICNPMQIANRKKRRQARFKKYILDKNQRKKRDK